MNDACNHTVQLTNERGERIGSWQTFTDKRGQYVACGRCGKFYGRIASDRSKVEPATKGVA